MKIKMAYGYLPISTILGVVHFVTETGKWAPTEPGSTYRAQTWFVDMLVQKNQNGITGCNQEMINLIEEYNTIKKETFDPRWNALKELK